MELNSTLFVQMVNFFITYWVLRVFLLEPVVALLIAEGKRISAIKSGIKRRKNNVAEQVDQLEKEWQKSRTFFEKNRPVEQVVLKNSFNETFSPELTSDSEMKKEKQALAKAIIQEVLHAD